MSGTLVIEITIWPAVVSDARLQELSELLSSDERERAARIRSKLAAQEFIVGRSVARRLLVPHSGVGAANLSLASRLSGKPYVADSDVAFNLSHSKGVCALAVGRVREIGIDIEFMNSSADVCAEDIFGSQEADQFAALPSSEQTEAFYRAWVLKEAYLKATGEGLAGGMKSLEVGFKRGPVVVPVAIRGHADLTPWQFESFDAGAGIAGAVAVDAAGRPSEIRFHRIGIEDV
jgi:4'-phosphopantetheinyl transferase